MRTVQVLRGFAADLRLAALPFVSQAKVEETVRHWLADGRRAGEDGELAAVEGEAISTAFVESAVNEIVAKRMNKAQQMRWNRATVQPFLDVRTAVRTTRSRTPSVNAIRASGL
jgi:hypothetical protein